jgi:hypothetical protein
VFDTETNETTVYSSMSEAAGAIGAGKSSISKGFKSLPEGESAI